MARDGPIAYENWRAMIDGLPERHAFEHPVYTDARLGGELTHESPYRFYATMPMRIGDASIPSAVVRVSLHLEVTELKPLPITNDGSYHGGDLLDEVTALASLALGIRLKPGPQSRIFEHDDPRGRPVGWDLRRVPRFLQALWGTIIPSAREEHSLADLTHLGTFPHIDYAAAIALVRVARLYQDALWVAESEPATAWLLLVSAVETAAAYHYPTQPNPVAALQEARPSLHSILSRVPDRSVLEDVADDTAHLFRSTKKFIDFVIAFLPPEPAIRPPVAYQHSWSAAAWKKTLSKIYERRSKALHEGIPFPPPMCEPPVRDIQSSVGAEKPLAIASYGMGGAWTQDECPVHLHIFEYVARSALHKWWRLLPTRGA